MKKVECNLPSKISVFWLVSLLFTNVFILHQSLAGKESHTPHLTPFA